MAGKVCAMKAAKPVSEDTGVSSPENCTAGTEVRMPVREQRRDLRPREDGHHEAIAGHCGHVEEAADGERPEAALERHVEQRTRPWQKGWRS